MHLPMTRSIQIATLLGIAASGAAVVLPAAAQVNPRLGMLSEAPSSTDALTPVQPSGIPVQPSDIPAQPSGNIPVLGQTAPASPSIFNEPPYNVTPVPGVQRYPGGVPFPDAPSPAAPSAPDRLNPDDVRYPGQIAPGAPQEQIAPDRVPSSPSGSYPYETDPSRTPGRLEVSPQIR